MKRLLTGLILFSSVAASAGNYAVEFPSNTKRIVALTNIKSISNKLAKKVSELRESSSNIERLSIASKNKFCMKLGEVNALGDMLRDSLENSNPGAPYMLNRTQDDYIDIAKKFSNKVSNNVYQLNQYCKGAYKLDSEERFDLIWELVQLGSETHNEYARYSQADKLLSPMNIEELQQVSSEKEIKKEEIKEQVKKECLLF